MANIQSPEGEEESKEFLGLKEFFSLAVKTFTTLAGTTACYLLFGYLIIISYASNVRVYGLTPFSQDLYREAAIRFLGDMFETYGRHPLFTTVMVCVISGICYVAFVKYSEYFNARIQFVAALVMILTVLTLRLDCIPDTFYFMFDLRRIFLYMVSIPLLVGLLIYLALSFRRFYKTMFKFYYIAIALFVMQFIAIPVGYGDNIFDIDLFPVVELECDGAAKIKSISSLTQAIDGQGAVPFFYLMGNTAEKLILFDNSALSPPAKMIIVDKGMVKYLKVSRHDTNSLRNILREQHYLMMAPQAYSDRKINIGELPADVLSYSKEVSNGVANRSITVMSPGVGIGNIQIGNTISAVKDKMNGPPTSGSMVNYEQGNEYWLNYDDLGITFIFDTAKKLCRIAVSNSSISLANETIRVNSRSSDIVNSFGKKSNDKVLEGGFRYISYPLDGISFTTNPKSGRIYSIVIERKTPNGQAQRKPNGT